MNQISWPNRTWTLNSLRFKPISIAYINKAASTVGLHCWDDRGCQSGLVCGAGYKCCNNLKFNYINQYLQLI